MGSRERLGIFCFYDKDGIVGEYVKVYLNSIMPYLKELVIVCNGQLSQEGKQILGKYANQIYIRENIGMDGGAYQDVILNVLGIEYIRQYEELLLFNDTVYAPIGSWEPVFERMKKEQVDFWGLTQGGTERIPPHIQSYFIMFRNKVLHSEDFALFWRDMDVGINDKNKVIANFEINLTYSLEKKGYAWGTYSKCVDKGIYNKPYFFLSQEHLPVLKVTIFLSAGDFCTTDEERKKTELYIKNQSDYDFNMIVDNLRQKEGKDVHTLKCKEPKNIEISERSISWRELLSYSLQYPKCYLYGNTFNADILKNLLGPDKLKGIVVSDAYGEEKNRGMGDQIFRWSEVCNDGEGLIVTVGYRNTKLLKDEILRKFPNAIFYWEFNKVKEEMI